MEKFKKGDFVYYYQNVDGITNTIPCEVVKVNKKTLVLDDGFDTYRNIRFSSCIYQIEHPSYQSEYPSYINK